MNRIETQPRATGLLTTLLVTCIGLGMGLYISSEIVKHHKGTINVESQLKQGSTFYFDLPLLA